MPARETRTKVLQTQLVRSGKRGRKSDMLGNAAPMNLAGVF